ncbi:MAG: hypothetical protein IKV68_06250 [Oscillospiraceae bacterium]|nr:hypothetical protein [Oscillospiraceae bacterium]
MSIQEIQILSAILDAATLIIFLIILGKIDRNTKTTNEYLGYIIQRLEQKEADNTLKEIEEELSLIREELDDTRQ